MPTYEYRCLHCQAEFSIQASMNDPQPNQGPNCKLADCIIRKCISRVFGQVAGATQAPAFSPAPTKAPESPTHVCAKYCDHH